MSDLFLAAEDPYDVMKKFKMEKTPKQICKDQRAQYLIPFMEEAYSIGYDEEPQYGKIIFMLEKVLLDMNCIPDRYFSWFQKSFIGRPIHNLKYEKYSS